MLFTQHNDDKRLINNISWLLLTEVAAKISRIAVIFTLAAHLIAIEYGTVMLALACHEIFKLVLRSGAGAQIIQCSDALLPSYAKNGALIQWLVCLILACSQAGLALPIAHFYGNPELFKLLALMAIVYLFYPIVSVKVFLLQRANNMRFYSIRNALCIFTENISIAVFAILDCGIFSVVYGKWVFVTLWVALFYVSPVQHFGLGFQAKVFGKLCKTSGQLVSTELVRALRMQLDMLIGARLLSPEMFGLYSFAKSAGVGLSQSINNAFSAAIYPYLCDKYRQKKMTKTIPLVYMITSSIGAVFLLQAIMVPVYLPLLFSQEWQQDHLVVILLCIAAIPAIYIDTLCNLFRAQAAYKKELYVRLFCLLVSTVGLLAIGASDPENFAFSILASSLFWLVALIPWKKLERIFICPYVTRS
jgi:PST family polysaccharide transporter